MENGEKNMTFLKEICKPTSEKTRSGTETYVELIDSPRAKIFKIISKTPQENIKPISWTPALERYERVGKNIFMIIFCRNFKENLERKK